MTGKYVLITRPEPGAQDIAAAVTARGFTPFIEPLMDIVPVAATLPALENYDALVFTSANAVRAFAPLSADRTLPVFAAGPQTAQAAQEAGFSTITASEGGVETLLPLLPADAHLLHPAGAHIAQDVPGADRIVIYEARGRENFSADLLALLDAQRLESVLFFSPRSAQIFADLIEKYARTDKVSVTRALCLSDSVLKCVRHLPWQDVQAAKDANRRAILDLL